MDVPIVEKKGGNGLEVATLKPRRPDLERAHLERIFSNVAQWQCSTLQAGGRMPDRDLLHYTKSVVGSEPRI